MPSTFVRTMRSIHHSYQARRPFIQAPECGLLSLRSSSSPWRPEKDRRRVLGEVLLCCTLGSALSLPYRICLHLFEPLHAATILHVLSPDHVQVTRVSAARISPRSPRARGISLRCIKRFTWQAHGLDGEQVSGAAIEPSKHHAASFAILLQSQNLCQ